MAVKVEFYLSDNDVDRLFAIKEDQGKNSLSGNEFARELVETSLHRLHPLKVRYDEDTGLRIKNPEDNREYKTVQEAIDNRQYSQYGFYSDVARAMEPYSLQEVFDYYTKVLGGAREMRTILEDKITADEIAKAKYRGEQPNNRIDISKGRMR
ncbi:MAG: hypothetical protein UE033_08310 [Coprococcus sp.]|jgi:hypothetical protein|nr:hypothetical protein [Coprococcus sp.]